LLSDFNGDAVRAFGVAREWRGLHDVAERSAFLIDREGIVRGAWRYADSELPDLDELVAAARALD
jgi:peroxiredoxin